MPKGLRDSFMTSVILLLSFLFGLVTDEIFETAALVPMVFVLGVFLVSVITEGYLCGVTASLISTLAVNFAFTFPYFEFNFTIPENLFSGVVMLVVAIVIVLAHHAGRVMTYASIIRAVWGTTDDGSVKKLQVNLANIRKKLGVGHRMISDDK